MYHMIINPASRSGRGKQYWNILEKYLDENHIEYRAYISKQLGHVTEIMRELTRSLDSHSEPIKVIVLGGDGTVNEALQGICNFEKVHFSYIPTGSSNDFARDFGVSDDPVQNLERILYHSQEKVIDLGKATYDIGNGKSESRYFAVSTGIGFDAAICAAVLHSKAKFFLNKIKLGKFVYVFNALKILAATDSIHATLTLEDSDKEVSIKNLLFLAGMNHKYEGGGFMFGPKADDTDGLLDLCLVSNVSKLKVLRVLPTAYHGNHFKFKGVDSYSTKCYTITTKEPMWLHTDGEILARTQTVTVSCVPKILHFFY